MKAIRKAEDRGKANFGWLKANYTFSFASYFNPAWMGYRSLRVINEDFIDEGMGFETHPHRDMEIISFIIDGALAHKDTLGNEAIIKPGQIQVMSAGTGIMHSEFNPYPDKKTHSIQIWIVPNQKSVKPRYDHHDYEQPKNGVVKLLSSFDGDGIAKIHQDMNLYLGDYNGDENHSIKLDPKFGYWLQVTKGSFSNEEKQVSAGDGMIIEDEAELLINSPDGLEFLLFELS